MRLNVGLAALCLCISLLGKTAYAQEVPYDHPLFTGPIHEMPSASVTWEHVAATVAFDAVAQSLDVEATYRFSSRQSTLDSLVLAAYDLTVDDVRIRQDSLWQNLRFTTPDTRSLIVYFDTLAVEASFELLVAYTATPKRGVLFKPATRRTWASAGGVLTQNIPGTTPYWLPTLDNPFTRITSDLTLTLPDDDWKALGPGQLLSDSTASANAIHFRSNLPHPVHQFGFAAGPYATYIDHVLLADAQHVALTYLVPPDVPEARLRQSFRGVREPFHWLRTTLDTPFPGRTLTILVDTPSDTVAPIAGHAFFEARHLVDQRASAEAPPTVALVEALLPRWIGHLTSVEYWFDHWVQDGLRRYLTTLYTAYRDDLAHVPLRMAALQAPYLAEAQIYQRPLVWDQWTNPFYMHDHHSSVRGAWVFYMLHQLLGDDAFTQSLELFLQRDMVDTNALQAAVESVLGRPFGAFFDQWVYAAGLPELDASYQYQEATETLELTITQQQEGYLVPAAFALELDLEISTLFETKTISISLTERSQTFSIPLSAAPRYVVIDPESDYLKTLTMPQSPNAWVAQLRNATTLSGRVRAAEALASFTSEPGVFIGLRTAFDEARDPRVQAAIVNTVAQRPEGAAEERLLLRALDDPTADVRAAALTGLARYASSIEVPSRVRLVAEYDPSYAVQAQAVATYAQLDTDDGVDVLRSALVTPSFGDQIRRTALDALSFANVEPIDRAEWSKPYMTAANPIATREAALAQIGRYTRPSRTLQNDLLDLLTDPAPRIRIAAIAASQHVPSSRRTPALRRRLAEEQHPLVRAALEATLAPSEERSN